VQTQHSLVGILFDLSVGLDRWFYRNLNPAASAFRLASAVQWISRRDSLHRRMKSRLALTCTDMEIRSYYMDSYCTDAWHGPSPGRSLCAKQHSYWLASCSACGYPGSLHRHGDQDLLSHSLHCRRMRSQDYIQDSLHRHVVFSLAGSPLCKTSISGLASRSAWISQEDSLHRRMRSRLISHSYDAWSQTLTRCTDAPSVKLLPPAAAAVSVPQQDRSVQLMLSALGNDCQGWNLSCKTSSKLTRTPTILKNSIQM
jgi:hypothetical protein